MSSKKPENNNLIQLLTNEEIRGKWVTLLGGIGITTLGSFFSKTSTTIAIVVMLIGCAITAAAVEQIMRFISMNRQ